MRGARGGRGGSCGFTLVELLIALSLMGLITLLLFSGLRVGIRAWEGVAAASERTAPVRLAHELLGRTLAQAHAVQVVSEAESRLLFGGTPESLELASPLGQHVGIPGLYVLRLVLEETGDDRRLVLQRWLLHPDVLAGGGQVPEWQPLADGRTASVAAGNGDEDLASGAYGTTLLLDGVEELQIAYFGIIEGAEEPQWHDEWLEQPTLPLAVRLRLTTTGQTWPDTLVSLPGAR